MESTFAFDFFFFDKNNSYVPVLAHFFFNQQNKY